MKNDQNMKDEASFSLDSAEEDERRALRYLVWTTALTLAVMLVWASLFQLDEITRGQGKVIPASREQIVQSLDAGVLAQMLVQEGETVEKDQVLMRIDDVRSGSVYREAREKMLLLSAQAARLRAEAYGLPLEFPDELINLPHVTDREQHAYLARKKSLDEQVQALTKSVVAITREISLTAPLVTKGVVSEVELLRLRRQQADIQSQLADRRNRYLTDANNELVRVESDLAQARESTFGREDAFKRTVLRSPMQGVVKKIYVNTVGGVIQAGQNLIELIPIKDTMLIEAYVKPSEVAFLRPGQPVVIKLTAYDFNRYGGLTGRLEQLSPDTMHDEFKPRKPGSNPVDLDEGYYRLLVSIDDSNSARSGIVMKPLPGMTATVEILTGHKSVIEYLFRPLQSVTQALRER